MNKKPVTLARVVAGAPPATVRTPDQWATWRREEDARMFAELQAQLDAWFELRSGATRH